MYDDILPLGDGRFEQKMSVDRRKLEAMITGTCTDEDDYLPAAHIFFSEVSERTGAEIYWPSQLKIGAKTKRDPFVKIQGTPGQVNAASVFISEVLNSKRERITLKIEIHHSVHSHLIGKGGREIQQDHLPISLLHWQNAEFNENLTNVMKQTRTHIHFPDSNKFSDASAKSDQVSISGSPSQVEVARQYLRSMSPVIINFDLPWVSPGVPEMFPQPVHITWQSINSTLYSIFVRSNSGDEISLGESIRSVLSVFNLQGNFPLIVRTSVMLRSDSTKLVKSPAVQRRFTELSCEVTVQAQQSDHVAIITGNLNSVLDARKYLINQLTVVLSFDIDSAKLQQSIQFLEQNPEVSTSYRRKMNSANVVQVYMKSSEENIKPIYDFRRQILGEVPMTIEVPPPSFSTQSSQFNFTDLTPKSPDPTDNPLAASILKGAKEIDKKNDRWGGSTKKFDRDLMLRKAAQAVFDDTLKQSPRYPTDHWAGYGFSSSLPAELLRNFITNGSNSAEPDLQSSPSMTPPVRGLCAVREEDELSDFGASICSLTEHTPIFDQRSKPAFSASTSIFDAFPSSSDVQWDVGVFNEPAKVLAQLGCSEYLALFREQEIDMDAFLLLDEQNLKDIGVCTIGARKKIHRAILKLRDSAHLYGLNI